MNGAIPRHVAIIMDGNGRWAKRRMLPRSAGHKAGFERMLALSQYAFRSGVKYITLYALSAENLQRPQEELEGLYSIFRTYFTQNVKKLKEKSVRLKIIGDLTLLPPDIEKMAREGEENTKEGTAGVLTLAIGYGSRQEIVSAVNEAVKRGQEVDMKSFSALLSTGDLPDPDLLIRTGKEKRISNFLLWQSAYTEFYFSDKYFPDFKNADFDKAIASYSKRERRFGTLEETKP